MMAQLSSASAVAGTEVRQHDGILHGHDLGRCEVGDVAWPRLTGLEGLGHGGVVDQGVAD